MAHTRHLTTLEHGAYMLLIMHYWQTGSLPNDETRLARIAGLTPEEWERSLNALRTFFQPDWKHKRIEEELAKAEKLSSAGRTGGLASGIARRAAKETEIERPLNGSGNDPPTKRQAPHSPSQSLEVKNLSSCGEAKRWTPPRHGATSTKKGRVFIKKGSPEWEAYASDWRGVHFEDPVPNEHGGKWFKTLGESA